MARAGGSCFPPLMQRGTQPCQTSKHSGCDPPFLHTSLPGRAQDLPVPDRGLSQDVLPAPPFLVHPAVLAHYAQLVFQGWFPGTFAMSPRRCVIKVVLGQAVGPYWFPSPPPEERPPMTALHPSAILLKSSCGFWVRGFLRLLTSLNRPTFCPMDRSVGE